MTNPITVGGPYKESDHHVPDPTDIVQQYNTEGVGAHGKIEEVSPIFTVDKVKVAQEIIGALDPKDTSVSSDRVLLPSVETDNKEAEKAILATAKARVKEGVVIGEATPAEAEAALEGTDGVAAAVEQDRSNAASNSTGTRSAGQHDDDETAKVALAEKEAADKKAAADKAAAAKK